MRIYNNISNDKTQNIASLLSSNPMTPTLLRPHAEDLYAEELAALRAADDRPKPPGWHLSPWSVVTYLLGGKLANGFEIEPKYIGQRRLMEIAVATLATDRALLLLGVPGTAKSWVSEHLTAAISGHTNLLVQGTAGHRRRTASATPGTTPACSPKAPSLAALVPSPLYKGMETASSCASKSSPASPPTCRTPCSPCSRKRCCPSPSSGTEIQARQGFNVIATANDRDRGVNELSSALRRRFNAVVLPLPATLAEEVHIVQTRVAKQGQALQLPVEAPALEQISRLVTIFRELRQGVTDNGKTKLKSPSGTLSTRRGHLRDERRPGPGRLLRRWHPARPRPGRRPHRRRHQRPRPRPRGVARIPRNRGQGSGMAGRICTGRAGRVVE